MIELIVAPPPTILSGSIYSWTRLETTVSPQTYSSLVLVKTITESSESSLPRKLRANFCFPFPVSRSRSRPVSRSLLFQLPVCDRCCASACSGSCVREATTSMKIFWEASQRENSTCVDPFTVAAAFRSAVNERGTSLAFCSCLRAFFTSLFTS